MREIHEIAHTSILRTFVGPPPSRLRASGHFCAIPPAALEVADLNLETLSGLKTYSARALRRLAEIPYDVRVASSRCVCDFVTPGRRSRSSKAHGPMRSCLLVSRLEQRPHIASNGSGVNPFLEERGQRRGSPVEHVVLGIPTGKPDSALFRPPVRTCIILY